MKKNVLSKIELNKIDAYFRESNYLSVGQLYLLDNPLLKRKLEFIVKLIQKIILGKNLE